MVSSCSHAHWAALFEAQLSLGANLWRLDIHLWVQGHQRLRPATRIGFFQFHSVVLCCYAAQTQHQQSLQRRDYSRSCIFHCAYLTLEGDSWVITLLVENASEKEIVISSLAAAISVATKLCKYFIRWNMQYHSGSLHVVCRTAWQVIRRQYQFLLAAWYNVYMLSCIHTRFAMYYIECPFHLVWGVKHISMFTLYNNRDMQWQTVSNTCNWFWPHLISILHMDVIMKDVYTFRNYY